MILPSLVPAIAAGSSLGFARALSEFGSLILIAQSSDTAVASLRILQYIESDNQAGAAVVATLLLLVAVLAIVALDVISRRTARRG